MQLMGGPMLSFYDWYADLPPASPQIWGDRTDVPEVVTEYNSGLHYDMGFKCTNGENTRCTLLAEVRYKGTKVVSVSPDFAESTKFADDWISVKQRYRRCTCDGNGARNLTKILRR